jgi:hypothetical protein
VSKLLYALPAYLTGVHVDYPESFDLDVRSRREWEVGANFQKQNRDRYHSIFRWTRLLPIIVTILGGCLICEWSTRLFGSWPGLVSLCAWCWMPSILAHGSLVTSDMLSAVLVVLAARSYWAFLLEPGLDKTIIVGLTLGLAVATKFTLLTLYPCWAMLLIGRALQLRATTSTGPRERPPAPMRLIAFGMLALITSIIVVNALHLFQDTGCCLLQLQPGFSSASRGIWQSGEVPAIAWLCRIPLPIPLGFLRGLDCQLADTERLQSAYLLGTIRVGGWWYWYTVASLIKLPLPFLVLFGLTLLRLPAALRGRNPLLWAALCLLLPAAEMVFVISATTGTGTNAAFRYLLPTLALLSVWIGSVGSSGSRATKLASIGLLCWLAFNTIIAIPDHLAWQNELAWIWSRLSGRPALIGDSLDWGQDIARLGDWVSCHSAEGSTTVCVYGLGEAEPYGLYSPVARPITSPGDDCTYLAASEQVLFSDSILNHISIAGESSALSQAQLEMLLKTRPFDRVGKTVRVYRCRDLGPEFMRQNE